MNEEIKNSGQESSLDELLELLLDAGLLLHKNGADSSRIERVVSSLANSLGCTATEIFITFNSIMITAERDGDYRTRLKRIKHHGVNLTIVSGVSRLSWRVAKEGGDIDYVRSELKRIAKLPTYNSWLVVVMVGLACGAFSRNAGGDWLVFGITTLAAAVAMFVRQRLTRHGFNMLLVIVLTAFTASLIAATAVIFNLGNLPHLPMACSVLLLVPGVQMINSIQDLISGHTLVGIARGVVGVLFSIYIALGLLMAMGITGVRL